MPLVGQKVVTPQLMTVTAEMESGTKVSLKVPVILKGPLAIHPSIRFDGDKPYQSAKWSVTVMTVNRSLADVDKQEDALRIANELVPDYDRAFSKPTIPEVKALLPGWVQHWMKECRRLSAYVDPTRYRGKR